MTVIDARPQAVRTRPQPAPELSGVTADPVRDYLRQIGRVPLLSAADEVDLARRIEAGLLAADRLATASEDLAGEERAQLEQLAADGRQATDRMLESNLRLVVSIAKRYIGRGLDLPDLIQEGNLGLIRAVYKFDYTKGYKFSTYATWWIRQAIQRALADQSRTIRLPVHVFETVGKLHRLQGRLRDELNRDPTPAELASAAGLSLTRVTELQRHQREPISLHTPLDNEGELGELIEDSDAANGQENATETVFRHQLRRALQEVLLATVSARDAHAMALRFGLIDGEPKTYQEIAPICGVSAGRLQQIERKTLAAIRTAPQTPALRAYLL
ncbi:RNA polymerase sigma factor [Planomonospora sphaerica]|uniref:RNA polymerase sigma factor n=1 Tax=Planomonospora sphaerica TaxID=161355 RepID=A0A161MCA2_9ACTN|nr:sigma-70 family RNA polymerase sigma factor [Planomonospora sphaerica]GAT68783.1 RNA polymerase sigma factor [Planomonospora sphaerica]